MTLAFRAGELVEVPAPWILAIDPGQREHGVVIWSADGGLAWSGVVEIEQLISVMRHPWMGAEFCVIEDYESHPLKTQAGHAYVPRTVDAVQRAVGRMQQVWLDRTSQEPALLARVKVTSHLDAMKRKGARTRDSQVIDALAHKFCPEPPPADYEGELSAWNRKTAKGSKAAPGPLYGIKSHAWQALGVAVTFHDTVLEAPF